MSISLEHITYTYNPGTTFASDALRDISLEIPDGQFAAVIGHTGSGKSTLIQHFNALIRPTSGHVYYNGEDVWAEKYDRRALRFHVGIVFQYPEHQLFETDVLTDVSFGPKNQGLSEEECRKRAVISLEQVGIGEDHFLKSPFELSGGQKRRAAIAGVLAMNPDVLILDEPTAGLDPAGRTEILDLISGLHRIRGISILLVTHSMEDAAKYAERLIVMNKGQVAFDGTPREIFRHYRELEDMDLAAPQVTYIMNALSAQGMPVDTDAMTIAEARDSILQAFRSRQD